MPDKDDATKTETPIASPISVTGSTANAEAIKKGINKILLAAVNGRDPKYRMDDGFVKWGLVEGDINDVIDKALR